jgi:hypothetical protein
MPRQMSPERQQEYTELIAFIDYYATHIWGLVPADPAHPSNVAKQLREQYGGSKALIGARMAVNDIVEMSSDESAEYVARLDRILREKGIITLSEVRRRFASSYKHIFKRGKIKNETEYHVVVGVLADASAAVSEEERAVLNSLVSRFEQKP